MATFRSMIERNAVIPQPCECGAEKGKGDCRACRLIRFNAALDNAKVELANLPEKVTDEQAAKREDWARIACTYAAVYSGTDNEFLAKMRDSWKAHKSLTISQMRGVLNVIRYNARQESKGKQEEVSTASVVAASANEIRNGYFTVSFEDGSHVTLRITKAQKKGKQNVSYLCGPSNQSDYRYFAGVYGTKVYSKGGFDRQLAALKVLMSADKTTLTAFGKAYAQESGNCYICGRLLTDPESIEMGIGPICAGKHS